MNCPNCDEPQNPDDLIIENGNVVACVACFNADDEPNCGGDECKL